VSFSFINVENRLIFCFSEFNAEKVSYLRQVSYPTQISSTRPELWAIYKTIQTLKYQETIKIYTDSQASIDVITSCLKLTPIREPLKKQNNMIIHQIVETIKTNNIKLNLKHMQT
jgi:ribonuclease HI